MTSDVIVSDYWTNSRIYLNEGATNPGNFPTKANLYSLSDSIGWQVSLGDFDGDGDIDVFGGVMYLSLNDGNGNFGPPMIIGNDLSYASAMMYSASDSAVTSSVSLFSLNFYPKRL